MTNTIKEILEFVEENDVKFVRLAFCDLFGEHKNISIVSTELERAFETGISINLSAIKGFEEIEKSDVFLFPDPNTVSVLPWRPQQGRVARFFCDIKYPDGSDFEYDARAILKKAIKRSAQMGYTCNVGTACEFYLFKTDENGTPTLEPYDEGGYLDIAPLDKGENIRREVCLTLEDMGMYPESSHHEKGPGQNEIDFRYSDALSTADNFFTFKSLVKIIAANNGLYASFMPKPLLGKSGNGLHLNISLSKDGQNIFTTLEDKHSKEAESFMAGVLEKAIEMTVFLNPIANSYERFNVFQVPTDVSWERQDRTKLIRVPAAAEKSSRMELRSPDPSINPYIVFALLLNAGLDGIEKELNLPEKSVSHGKLPKSLEEAIKVSKDSAFLNNILGCEYMKKYIDFKEVECSEFLQSLDKVEFYNKKYFKKI